MKVTHRKIRFQYSEVEQEILIKNIYFTVLPTLKMIRFYRGPFSEILLIAIFKLHNMLDYP